MFFFFYVFYILIAILLFRETHAIPLTVRFPSAVLAKNAIICQVVAYGMLKTKENLKLSNLQVVAMAYERWSLRRSSNHSDLSCQVMFYFGTSLLGGGGGCKSNLRPRPQNIACVSRRISGCRFSRAAKTGCFCRLTKQDLGIFY